MLQLNTNAFDENYLRHFKHRCTGFSNETVLQVFERLCNTYGNITELELIENEEKMKTSWNQLEPIETIFYQIEVAVEFAQHGDLPFTNNQLLNIAYCIMAQANTFKEACKEGRENTADKKNGPISTHYSFKHTLIGGKKVNTLQQSTTEVYLITHVTQQRPCNLSYK